QWVSRPCLCRIFLYTVRKWTPNGPEFRRILKPEGNRKWDSDDNFEWRVQRRREAREAAEIARRNAVFTMRVRLSNWLCAHAWVRESLPWRTHRPIVHAEKVEQKCVGCGWVRRGGLKLTWSSISDGSVLCHNCYMQRGDIAQVMPEGYGHVRFMSDLRARKDELDGPGSSAKWDDKKKSELDESARRTHILWQMTKSPWFQTLPWKTHRPVRTSLKVERTCPDCTALKSLKLWWQSLTSEESLCNRCYTKPSWPEVMPEGYEDVTTMGGLAKRRKELDSAAPASTNHIPLASPLLLQSTLNRPKSTKPVSPSQTPFSRAFSTRPTTSPSTNTSVSPPRSLSTTAGHPRTGNLPSITLMSSRSFSHSSAKDLTKTSPKLWECHRVKGNPEALREYYDRKAERLKYATTKTMIRRWDVARTNEGFRMALRIRAWVRTHAWVREHLPWKTHHPLRHDERVEHYCMGCKHIRRGGSYLWWQAKREMAETGVDADSYLCRECYVPKDDWRAAMPQGYEDVNTYHELKARKERLGVTGAAEHMGLDDRIQRKNMIRSCCSHPRVRELPWKTYRPVYFEDPASKTFTTSLAFLLCLLLVSSHLCRSFMPSLIAKLSSASPVPSCQLLAFRCQPRSSRHHR
ncbi:hypothetical protein D6C93_09299, partial [Aureobasidium pullulans]